MRDLDKDFLAAMREGMERGRQKGESGWDQYWENTRFAYKPTGTDGCLMDGLQHELTDLIVAIAHNDAKEIRREAADVANFAMMVADIHGALTPGKGGADEH